MSDWSSRVINLFIQYTCHILIIDRPWPFVIEIIRNFTGIKETMTVKLIYSPSFHLIFISIILLKVVEGLITWREGTMAVDYTSPQTL